MITRDALGKVLIAIFETGAYRATKYFGPKLVVRATKVRYKRASNSGPTSHVVVTVGRPNYDEREFIKKAIKAGEPFPIKRLQLKFQKPKTKARSTAR